MDNYNRDSLKTRKVVSNRLQDSKVAKASDLSSQRRKLIKASAAVVPAIMTLRSGAAAAMTSSANRCLTNPDTPINTTSEVGGIEPVLGDNEVVPPLDEWLRVTAKPGMLIRYATGNSSEKPYYLTRKDNTSFGWDNLDGWLIYDKDGGERDNLRNKENFITAWNNRVAFYGVDSYPGSMVFINNSGDPVNPPVPELVSSYMTISTTLVYLLAYYDPDTGVITYYPMPQGEALLVTGSCLVSINPAFQL